MVMKVLDRYKEVGNVVEEVGKKKVRPRLMAVVDEDSCTGCQVCIPFCPVDCIEAVPIEKYGQPIPPVQVRFNECIGCKLCEKACRDLTWDAIRMLDTNVFEDIYGIAID